MPLGLDDMPRCSKSRLTRDTSVAACSGPALSLERKHVYRGSTWGPPVGAAVGA